MKLVRGLVVTLGVLLVLAGGAAAAVVGPDDTVMLGSTTQEVEGRPVVTDPAITAFSGLDLVVEAKGDDEVFVGAAHRVDVEDMVADVAHLETYALRPGSVDVSEVDANRSGDFTFRPDSDLWRHQASGPGTQVLEVPLTGEPVSTLVFAGAESPEVTLGYGFRLGGVFVAGLVTALVGLALVVLAVVLGRRSRRTRTTATAPAAEPAGATGHGEGNGRVTVPNGTPGPTARLALPLALTALVAGGCALPAAESTEPAGRAALPRESFAKVTQDFVAREKAAAEKAQKPTYDHQAWNDLYAGEMAENAVVHSRIRELEKEKAGDRWFNDFHGTLANPTFDAYPMWALLTSDLVVPDSVKEQAAKDKKATKVEDIKTGRLTLFVRDRATQPWKTAAEVQVDLEALPGEVTDPRVGDEAATERARKATAQLTKWWATGKKPAGVTLDTVAKAARKDLAAKLRRSYVSRSELVTATRDDDESRLRVVEVEGGHVAISTFEVQDREYAKPGGWINWNNGYRSLHGQGPNWIHRTYAVTTALLVPEEGKVTSLGTDVSLISG